MSYEFNAAENEIIHKTGKRTRLWGMLTLGGGVLTALLGVSAALTGGSFGVVAGIFYILLASIPIVSGRSFVQAGNSLSSVVTTEGNDLDHLLGFASGHRSHGYSLRGSLRTEALADPVPVFGRRNVTVIGWNEY